MIVKIMIEVLSILAIATREISQSRASKLIDHLYESRLSTDCCSEKYLKKVVGRTDIEDSLARLDFLTQEEVRMAAAQGLKSTHAVHVDVKSAGDHVLRVDDRVQGVGSDVQQVNSRVQRVDDKVQGVHDEVQVVGDKVQGIDDKVQKVADDIGDQKRSSSNNLI